MKFDAQRVKNDIVSWIKSWFNNNGGGCNAIVGISGGKDSSVVASLCVEALGKDKVIGVLMPEGFQGDINSAYELVNFLGIRSYTLNIEGVVTSALHELASRFQGEPRISIQTRINLPARIRMSMLYAVSQSHNGRVANTCNLSEDWVGYSTRYGDSVGDFSPLSNLTVSEVKAIGYELGLPKCLIEKIPEDGLCEGTDEDNLGFTYEALDKYIRTGECDDVEVKSKIDDLHFRNEFKLKPMPVFTYKERND